MPHATLSLCPMTTPGSPENVNPETWNGHAALSVRHWRLTCPQMPGIESARCGSLASSGLPVVVREPETTHEFEPMPSPRPRLACTASTEASAESTAALPSAERSAVRAAGAGLAAWSLCADDGCQSCAERIGWLRSTG